MQKIRVTFFFIALSLQVFSQKIPVDLFVFNAQVYTANPDFAVQEAFVVKNGLFLEVGKTSELQKKYTFKKSVDAYQKAIYPGFYDPHAHFLYLGQLLNQCDLTGTKSFEEVLERLKIYSKKNPEIDWIVGRGWDQNDWAVKEFPTKEKLSSIFPAKPVFLTRIDGHALLANDKALRLAKVTAASKVFGGEILLQNNKPTGILIDNAMELIKRVFPKPSEKLQRKMILDAQKECLKYGLTTVSDAGVNQEDIDLIAKMQSEKVLKIRDYAMVSIGLRNIDYFTQKGIIKTDRLNVRSFKIYADGALGSRGANLLKPYSDDASNSGLALMSKNEMDKYFEKIYASDYQANTHCIGDSANKVVLELYGKYLKNKNDRRWRIEHAQIIAPEDVSKYGQFSIIPSVQTTHATSDMYWAEQRLGKERIKTAYIYNDLKNQNGLIANGSDFPVEYVNPIFGFHAAVARQDAKNWPEGGFQMENALSRQDALKAMTIWSAYANFEEKERGSIEKGKMADFVILDADIMQIENAKIRNTKVLSTYVGGEKLY